MTTLTIVLVVVFAALCFFLTTFMPWAELGMPEWGPFAGLREPLMNMMSHLEGQKGAEYYIYAVMLGLAMICAAIAINVIGRLDAEEKTVLPLKK
jgi:hypothetical protein